MFAPFIECYLPVQPDERITKPLQGVCEKCQLGGLYKRARLKWDLGAQQLVGYEVTNITRCAYCLTEQDPAVDGFVQCYLPIVNDKRLSELQDVCKKCGSLNLHLIASLKWDHKMQYLVVFEISTSPWCNDCTFKPNT